MEIVQLQNRIMRKTIILLIILSGYIFGVQAQVTIGSGIEPHKDALLDLKENVSGTSSKGIVLPRVQLTSTELPAPLSEHLAGMTVYNLEARGTGATQVYPGFYYSNGVRWKRLVPENTIFFYAPSITVPTDATTAPEYNNTTAFFTLDLHEIYASQFTLSGEGISAAHSPAAGSLPVMGAQQLDYFVTYYDNTVFTDVSVTNDGHLSYKLIPGFVITEKTFMNVVFKVK